jgi:voltage-gated potassium channel
MTQERWQKLTEWPLIAASLVFLVAYSWEVISNLQGAAQTAAEIAMWATWALFLADYVVEFSLAPRGGRWRWFSTHLFDLAVIVLPMLRPLRVLRVITLLNVLQRTAGTALRGRIVVYTAAAASLLVFLASLAVLDSERGHPGATITTFPRALWWAFVTITTVGYGDYTPITLEGRVIAVGLMIGGIALLGVVTATLASWIVERVAATDAEKVAANDAVTVAHIDNLEAKIDDLQRALLAAIEAR